MIVSGGASLVVSVQLGATKASAKAVPNVLDSSNPNELTPEEQKQVDELKKTDQEVRSHEQAHKTVGGPYAGAIQLETVTGPDGREYAVAGEVPIDASPIPNNPEATIRKLDIVIRAALAPAQPSPQDFSVARAAQQARIQAQRELLELQDAERREQAQQNQPLSEEGQDAAGTEAGKTRPTPLEIAQETAEKNAEESDQGVEKASSFQSELATEALSRAEQTTKSIRGSLLSIIG